MHQRTFAPMSMEPTRESHAGNSRVVVINSVKETPLASTLAKRSGDTSRGRWQASLEEGQKRLASHLQLAQASLSRSAEDSRLPPPLANELAAIAVAAGQLKESVEKLSGPHAHPAGDRTDTMLTLGHRALRAFAELRSWQSKQKKRRHTHSLESLKKGVSELLESAREYVQHLSAAVDFHKNIDALGAGDVYRLQLGENREWGAIEVHRRTDSWFHLKIEGSALLSFYFTESPTPLTGELASAEWLWARAQDVRKAVALFMQHLISHLEGTPSTASSRDMDFLSSRISALDVVGPLAEAFNAVTTTGEDLLPAFEDTTCGARIEWVSQGSLDLLVYRKLNAGKPATGALVVQSRTKLSPTLGVPLKRQPLATMNSLAQKAILAEQAECILTTKDAIVPGGLADARRVTLAGDIKSILQSGAAHALFGGQLREALLKAGAPATVRASSKQGVVSQMALSSAVGNLALGLAVPVIVTREDNQTQKNQSFSGSALSAARELGRFFATALEKAPTPGFT